MSDNPSATRRSVPMTDARLSTSGGIVSTCSLSRPSCVGSTSQVRIDVSARCMCVGASCFGVGIGYNGPSMTRNGTSQLGLIDGVYNRSGGRYRTRSTTSLGYDDDAIALGIPANDRVGRWIHKPRNCVRPATSYRTAGCIAVPCSMWSRVKESIGQSVTVCGGSGSEVRPPSLYSSRYYPAPRLGPQLSYGIQSNQTHYPTRRIDPSQFRMGSGVVR